MNSLSSLNPNEEQDSSLMRKFTHRRLMEDSSRSEERTELRDTYEESKSWIKHPKEISTYTNGFRISAKQHTHFPPVKMSSTVGKPRCPSEMGSITFQNNTHSSSKHSAREQEIGRDHHGVAEKEEPLVTPRKQSVLRKTKTFRQEKQDNESRLEYNLRIQVPNVS